MGAWQGLDESSTKAKVVAFEPLQSPLLTTGKGGRIKSKGSVLALNRPFWIGRCSATSVPLIKNLDLRCAVDWPRRKVFFVGLPLA
jgi:hypothetical protein